MGCSIRPYWWGLYPTPRGHDLSHAEGNSLATAMLPLHRIKKSENRALNSASSIKDYIANGGSVSGLKAEVALGNVILDEANTDILTRGSYLWVSDSELHNNSYITCNRSKIFVPSVNGARNWSL